MKNLGNLDGEYYFSDADVVAKIVSFIPRDRQFSRLYCPTAGDGAIAKQIHATHKHCNDIQTRNYHALMQISSIVTHDDARNLEMGPYDLIVDNLPLYLYDRGRNVCGDILLKCAEQLTTDGVLILTVPHNFFKKQYNKDILDCMPEIKTHLITNDDIPQLHAPFFIITVGV